MRGREEGVRVGREGGGGERGGGREEEREKVSTCDHVMGVM